MITLVVKYVTLLVPNFIDAYPAEMPFVYKHRLIRISFMALMRI